MNRRRPAASLAFGVLKGIARWRSAMTTSAVIAGCVLLWPAGPGAQRPASLAPGDHTLSLRHGGRLRTYLVHVPSGASPARTLPVVLAFHGGGGEAGGFKDYAGLDAVADREGFLVVYPNGTGPLPRRLLTWNAGDCCGYAMTQRVDDVDFAIGVLDDVARRTPVDARRVYATGHSNGAMMAYRLGAERASRVAAIAPVAGAYNLDRFAPDRPVAVLHIHSVDDPRALYAGGIGPSFPGTDVRSSHRPVEEGLERWRRHNGCSPQARSVERRSGTPGTGGTGQSATLLAWEGCARGGQVRHWRLTGVGHGWPGHRLPARREELAGPSTSLVLAAEEIWTFFAPLSR
jgi:polyhydroxybutyrate depolymerase